jgi:hypothetical protein
MTPILNSVHTSNDSLHRQFLPLSDIPRIENECSEQGHMTEMSTILNNVHTSNNSLHRKGVPLSVVVK